LLVPVLIGTVVHAPCVVHHEFEVVITVDGCADEGVVVFEFLQGDLVISDTAETNV
jgi:hypothetical protein